jgi:hypothetical protein
LARAFTLGLATSGCLLLLEGGCPVIAQDLGNPKYRLTDRKAPDRKEGIKPLDRAGEYLDLVGVFLDVPGLHGRDEPREWLRLGFYLQERERRVSIQVRDYGRFREEKYHYWMIPAETVFDSGFRQFAWDADLARELGIRPEHLGAVAKVDGRGYRLVVPLLLAAARFPSTVRAQGVRFVFVPNETMTVDYRVHPQSAPSQVLLRGTAEAWIKDQRSEVRWPGPGRQPAGEGAYMLALTAKVSTPQGLTETIPLDYAFYYRPELVVER